jgi:hypothetical protein
MLRRSLHSEQPAQNWSGQGARFIVQAIAPAHVSRVYIDEHTHSMELIVPDDQLSKAIGRRGQNVRLAAQLTGWRIDIYSESRHVEINEQALEELSNLEPLEDEDADLLIRHGYRTLNDLYDADPYEIAIILNIEEDDAEDICDLAGEIHDRLEAAAAEAPKESEESEGAEGSEGSEVAEGAEGAEGSEDAEGAEGAEGSEDAEGAEGAEGAEAAESAEGSDSSDSDSDSDSGSDSSDSDEDLPEEA